jgi:hypothetical protein
MENKFLSTGLVPPRLFLVHEDAGRLSYSTPTFMVIQEYEKGVAIDREDENMW